MTSFSKYRDFLFPKYHVLRLPYRYILRVFLIDILRLILRIYYDFTHETLQLYSWNTAIFLFIISDIMKFVFSLYKDFILKILWTDSRNNATLKKKKKKIETIFSEPALFLFFVLFLNSSPKMPSHFFRMCCVLKIINFGVVTLPPRWLFSYNITLRTAVRMLYVMQVVTVTLLKTVRSQCGYELQLVCPSS